VTGLPSTSVAVRLPIAVPFSAIANVAGEVNAGESFTALTVRLTLAAALSATPSFAT
jgi:hypothetical protein